MLKIHGVPFSAHTRKVIVAASREVFLRPARPDRMEESVVEMQFPLERLA
jgi:hypothetical protein